MDKIALGCKEYVSEVLAKKFELDEYLEESTILLNTYENNRVWDFMILMDNKWFKYEFAHLYSEYFVVDDHEHEPPVFTRVKNYKWLTENFAKRLPVALWIFQNVIVIQEKENLFSQIIVEQQEKFNRVFLDIIERKYLEMRGDRHNLRYSVDRVGDLANILLKANIVKLCFEISLLADKKPYPFRTLLPDYTKENATNGHSVFPLAQEFLVTMEPEKTIALSEKLIDCIVTTLQEKKFYSDEFLLKWWLYIH